MTLDPSYDVLLAVIIQTPRLPRWRGSVSCDIEVLSSSELCRPQRILAHIQLARSIGFIIGYQAIIFTVHQRRRDHEISRSPVAGNRDIPYNRHTQKRLYIWIMRHGLKWIPEKDEEIDLVVYNLGPNLLITSQRPAFEFRNLEAKFAFEDFSRGASRIYPVMSQEVAVIFGPFHQVELFIIVGDKSYLLVMFHWNFFVSHNTM